MSESETKKRSAVKCSISVPVAQQDEFDKNKNKLMNYAEEFYGIKSFSEIVRHFVNESKFIEGKLVLELVKK